MGVCDTWNVEMNILVYEIEMFSLPTEFHFKVAGTPTQVFSSKYCGIFKNPFFIEQFWCLRLNFFTRFQKETVFSINRSDRKTLMFFPNWFCI